MHFTPTSGSWLNLVEIFFGIITRQPIRRGTHRSVAELIEAIQRFIDGWNERCEPFAWTKTPDDIIAKAVRPTTSNCDSSSAVHLCLPVGERATPGGGSSGTALPRSCRAAPPHRSK